MTTVKIFSRIKKLFKRFIKRKWCYAIAIFRTKKLLRRWGFDFV